MQHQTQNDNDKFVRIWQAVLLQMLADLFSHSVSQEAETHRSHAKNWLRPSNPDFREVCENGCQNPERVYKHVQRMLDEGYRTGQWKKIPIARCFES